MTYQLDAIVMCMPMHVQYDRVSEFQNEICQPLRMRELRIESPQRMVADQYHLIIA